MHRISKRFFIHLMTNLGTNFERGNDRLRELWEAKRVRLAGEEVQFMITYIPEKHARKLEIWIKFPPPNHEEFLSRGEFFGDITLGETVFFEPSIYTTSSTELRQKFLEIVTDTWRNFRNITA